MQSEPRYAEVAVQRPVPGRYHYRVPAHLAPRTQIGARVLVLFGAGKVTGVVTNADAGAPPEGVAPVDLSDVLDGDEPSLSAELVELCLWIAEYYEAPPGEVMRAALPGGTSVAAHEVIAVTAAGRDYGGALPGKQREVLAAIAAEPQPTGGMTAAMKKHVAALEARGLLQRQEQRDEARTRLPRERIVELAPGLDLAATKQALGRAPKRLAVLNALAASASTGPLLIAELARSVHGAAAAIRELERAQLVVTGEREVALGAFAVDEVMQGAGPTAPPQLTGEQQVAVDAILAALAVAAPPPAPSTFTPFLLHGVTGSGKTEVYLRVIAEALAAGRTALVLVPEISLTPQLAARFRARFGHQVAILHSGMSEPQRLAEWSRLRRGDARIVVGARSAVFAPLANLGVVVVDEEHDGSYKQDEGVKYHARDVALVRAQRAGAVCVLGSATPSLESYAHAERGLYKRLALTERPTARPMPSVEIVDLRTYLPDGEAFLSSPLRSALRETLAAGDQAIVFLNRRGFATFVLCRACGHAFRCPDCSVSLTYHRWSDGMSCHYCGHFERVPDICPGKGCGKTGTIERKGLGTEKVAEAIAAELAPARVGRLDRDVASGPRIEAVLARVARRELDVLVGTQMVTKGHDFPGVTLVGVLCADTGLNLPDFRASERTFQLLAQVAGRAGRGDRPGRVIVQTYRPTASAVVAAAAHDYTQFFAAESAERAEVRWPPHGRLITIRIDGTNEAEVRRTSERLGELANRIAREPENAGVDVLGPVESPLARIRKRSRWQIVLRAADRHALRRVARGTVSAELPSAIRVSLDVDPISAM